MITIVDYGVGNVRAIANIYDRLGVSCLLASTTSQLEGAERLLLPGVGAFDWAMDRLQASGMRDALDQAVLNKKVPVLGICVGMQMLAMTSDEGRLPGLGWIDADVKRFDDSAFDQKIRLPHMGWNDVEPRVRGGLFAGLEAAARFYFLHSFYVRPRLQEDVLATTDYNGQFVSSVGHENVFGVQFHPEKSHEWGIRLLKNFAEMSKC